MDPTQSALGGAFCHQSSTGAPSFALRGASDMIGDQWGSLLEFNVQRRWSWGAEAYRCSYGCMVRWLPSDRAPLGRRLSSRGASVSSSACGALPVSVGRTWPLAVPWPRALEAEHVCLGSALEAARWRQLALSDVRIKNCSRYMSVTPGRCD